MREDMNGRIRVLRDGMWVVEQDPIADLPFERAYPQECDLVALHRSQGYNAESTFGSDDATLWLEVFRNQKGGDPEYLIAINLSCSWDVVGASNTIDLMKLLTQWLTAVQSASITTFINMIEDSNLFKAEILEIVSRNR